MRQQQYIPQRASRTSTATPRPVQQGADDLEEDDMYYPQRMPSSARRYTTTQGQEVIEQGNKKIIIHHEPPPKKNHWVFFVGVAFFVMIIGWVVFTLVGNWWQGKQADWKYGSPRTFQTDQFVGHSDSPDHPNHFIAVDLNGSIEVLELNANPKLDHIYVITTVPDPNTPITLSFTDINHDGKIDMLATIGTGTTYTVVLLNDGKQFKPQ